MKFKHNTLKRIILLMLLSAMLWATAKTVSLSAQEKKIQVVPDIPSQSDLSSFPIRSLKPGWWESSGLIYFQIPARILFKLGNDPEAAAEKISNQAWDEFERIGKIFNPFAPASEVSLINALKKTGQVRISNDVFDVLKLSSDIWAKSNGHFDPTLLRIKTLWRIAEKNQQIPSEKELFTELQASGFDKVHFSTLPEPVLKVDHPDIMFDFGGIVKGYAVDRVREILIKGGAVSCLVQLGGEVSTFGDNDDAPWRIGIQHPLEMDKIWGIISEPGRLNVSTSGNYAQPIIIQGRSFYHIFNPKTGKPVSGKILGVTTASLDGKISSSILDGAATAITVMGVKSGLEFARNMGIDVLILFEKKDSGIGEIQTPGFRYVRNSD
jgi:FAD:protein FMN transferase